LLKQRAVRQLKRNLSGVLSRLSWQFPYRSPLIRYRSATAIKLHRTHTLCGHFHRQPGKHTLSCSATGHSKHGLALLYTAGKPNSQEKTLKKWFSFKNLKNMRLVSVEMNRIGYYSSVSIAKNRMDRDRMIVESYPGRDLDVQDSHVLSSHRLQTCCRIAPENEWQIGSVNCRIQSRDEHHNRFFKAIQYKTDRLIHFIRYSSLRPNDQR
jgi:hypothetical protein